MTPLEVYNRFIAGESVSDLERAQYQTRDDHKNDWVSADALLRRHLLTMRSALLATSDRANVTYPPTMTELLLDRTKRES